MQAKAEYYRNLARRTREIAGRIDEAEAREHMLSVGEQYDKLAVEAEAQK